MVLTHRVELDVLHHHHLLCSLGVKDGIVDHLFHGDRVPACEIVEGLRHPQRGAVEPLSLRILAHLDQLLPDQGLQTRGIYVGDIVEVFWPVCAIRSAQMNSHDRSNTSVADLFRDLHSSPAIDGMGPFGNRVCDRERHMGGRQHIGVWDLFAVALPHQVAVIDDVEVCGPRSVGIVAADPS